MYMFVFCLLQRSPEQFKNLSATFNVAVSVFHAYAHNSHCQYFYSPRHRVGFGLSDGENLERLWSFLGKFCDMTKEMNAANRINTLSDALQHYAQQKSAKMGKLWSLLMLSFIVLCPLRNQHR